MLRKGLRSGRRDRSCLRQTHLGGPSGLSAALHTSRTGSASDRAKVENPPYFGRALSLLVGARLYVILTSHLCKRPILETARLALEGGADMLQLREKGMPDRDFLRLALELRKLTAKMGRLFIINDCPSIALESGADGLHLGQGDMPIGEARKLLGRDFIIGLSTHSLEQAELAYKQGADYIGIGPIFPTQTKPKERPIGTEILYKMKDLPIPCFAIGGITLTNLSEVTGAGVGRVAVCSAVISQDDALNATRLFSQTLRSGRGTLQRAPTL